MELPWGSRSGPHEAQQPGAEQGLAYMLCVSGNSQALCGWAVVVLISIWLL